jgi:hypothetical protein
MKTVAPINGNLDSLSTIFPLITCVIWADNKRGEQIKQAIKIERLVSRMAGIFCSKIGIKKEN